MPHIHHEEHGSGEPTLLIQGGDASLLWWPRELVEGLVQAGRRVIAYDHRDCGLSEYVSSPYTIDDMAGDAIRLLDTLQIDRAHVIGVSMGGMIAQVLALRAPARVATLTLLATTPGPDERLPDPPRDPLAGIDWDGDPIDVNVEFCRAVAGSRFPFDEPFYRALATADAARGTNPQTAHARILQSTSRLDRLAEITAPTLVVHGSEDLIFPSAHAEAMAARIPDARLVVWEGVGHELPPQLMSELVALL